MKKKSAIIAGAFSLMLVVGACGSTDSDSSTTHSSSHPASHSTSAAPSEVTSTVTEEETPAATPAPVEPKAQPQPEQDDDPGGHPCTDQSGAPGHLIPGSGGGWVCEITGDAPRN